MIPLRMDPCLSSDYFEREDLCACLRELINTCFPGPGTKQALGPLVTTGLEDVMSVITRELQSREHIQCQVTDLDASGNALSTRPAASIGHLWELLRVTNPADGPTPADRPKAFGRLVQIRSIPPIVALQLLASLSNHFDVKRLLLFLVRDKYTGSYVHSSRIGRLVHEGFAPQAYWCFTMKYYYLNHKEPNIFEKQVSGIFHDKDGNHICRGSSVVSLALDDGGCLVGEYPDDSRLPWRLVILSCNQRIEYRPEPLRNAVEAFLWAVASEMDNVHEQLNHLSARVAALAVPSDDFLFDRQYQESLLFEDEQFTNSKTHFWAIQTLRTVNECITDLIRHWRNFDTGSSLDVVRNHEIAWLRRSISESQYANAEFELMNGIRERHKKTEAVIEKFKGLKERNIARQEEIVALRDGLFNASTVLEARTTVLQGRNIQLLTYISMLFLPASFVTSLFGMEAVLPPSMEIKAFALIFGLVCGLTYITILMMGFGGADWIIKKARRRQPKAKRNRKSQQTRKPKRQMWKIGRVRKLKRTVDAENGG